MTIYKSRNSFCFITLSIDVAIIHSKCYHVANKRELLNQYYCELYEIYTT